MKILAIIPARGGSKGISGKNLKLVGGHPLIYWTIEAARNSANIDRMIVSTDDLEIAEFSKKCGAEVPFIRPSDLARDDTPTLPVLQHTVRKLNELDGYKPDAVITLQPTSPLRQTHHIDEALKLFIQDPDADSLVSCIEVPHIFHPLSVMRKDSDGYLKPFIGGNAPVRRQDKEQVYARNGAAIYITRTTRLDDFVFGGKLLPFFMSPEYSLDIDTEEDLAQADRILGVSNG